MKNAKLFLLILLPGATLLAREDKDSSQSKAAVPGSVKVSNYTAHNFTCVIAGDSKSGSSKTIAGQDYYKYPGKVFSRNFNWGSGATKGILNPQLACGRSVVFGKPKIILTVPYASLKDGSFELHHGDNNSPYVIYSAKSGVVVATMSKENK